MIPTAVEFGFDRIDPPTDISLESRESARALRAASARRLFRGDTARGFHLARLATKVEAGHIPRAAVRWALNIEAIRRGEGF